MAKQQRLYPWLMVALPEVVCHCSARSNLGYRADLKSDSFFAQALDLELDLIQPFRNACA